VKLAHYKNVAVCLRGAGLGLCLLVAAVSADQVSPLAFTCCFGQNELTAQVTLPTGHSFESPHIQFKHIQLKQTQNFSLADHNFEPHLA
jgi:hypothetical protein